MNLPSSNPVVRDAVAFVLSAAFLVGVAGANTIPREAGVPDFTVMSYNVRGEVALFNEAFHTAPDQQAGVRAAKQILMLQKHWPDVLGTSEETAVFNEVYTHFLGDDYGIVGDYLFTPATLLSPYFSNTNQPDANRIYYKLSVFNYLGSQTIWLHEGDVHKVGKIEGETNVRGATMAALTFRETHEKVVICNTHLGLNDVISNRQMEILVRETEAFAKRYGITAILYMGDFNMGYTVIKALPASKYKTSWDNDVKSYNQTGKGRSWVDHVFINGSLRFLGRLSLDGSEWIDSDTSSDHDPLLVNVCFSSYVPRGDVADNSIKAGIYGDRLQIQSGIIAELDWGNAFALFYDANDQYIGAVQLVARRDGNGDFYLADSIYVPSEAQKVNVRVTGGKTYGVWFR